MHRMRTEMFANIEKKPKKYIHDFCWEVCIENIDCTHKWRFRLGAYGDPSNSLSRAFIASGDQMSLAIERGVVATYGGRGWKSPKLNIGISALEVAYERA